MPGFWLLNNQCLSECPLWAPGIDRICYPTYIDFKNGTLYYRNYFNTNFIDIDIANDGFTLTGRPGMRRYSDCGNRRLVGGYGILGKTNTISKTFGSLPPHGVIYLAFELYFIDGVTNTDTINVFIDNVLTTTISINPLTDTKLDRCGKRGAGFEEYV